MLNFTSGDLLRDRSDALVNTVNCVGVMGRGVALQFKKAFPENFKLYKEACDRGEVMPGRMFVTERNTLGGPRFIINFPTKRHWRGNSRIEDIEAGLHDLREVVHRLNLKSLAMPPLGSGLGGLRWQDVRTLIEERLADLDVEINVYEPGNAPSPGSMVAAREAPRMTPGRATLVTLMHRYLDGLLDPFVTLIEVQKLMYFMQAAGQPLRLNYRKHHYGPYADNLRHVLNDVEGHLVSGYADGGDQPHKRLELVPGAFDDSQTVLNSDAETNERLKRVSTLVEGFETPRGMELLATVHWLIEREGAREFEDVLQKTYEWNARKRSFTPRQIKLAFERLKSTGWAA